MDWIVAICQFWLNTLGWLAAFAIAFGLLARLTPCNPGMYWWKDLRAVGTDFIYWFVAPLFLGICRTLMLFAGVLLLFAGREPRFLPVKDLPLYAQCAAILLIQEILLYWVHRLFHTRLAWKFHAVHHSPTVLDWMSAGRFHVINHLLEFGLADVCVLLLGFSPVALVVLAPFQVIYSAMVHANLNWTFGPLRYVFASPVFHRWHHTTQGEGIDKNFASTFPVLDVVFGTFYMPPNKLPERFGTGDSGFPEGFWGQFLHPFTGKDARLSFVSPIRGAARWAHRRPVVAGLFGMSALAVLSVLGVGVCRMVQRGDLDEEGERAEAEQHANRIDRAWRAWAENDLVRANALLDAAPGPFRQTSEQQHLRDLCRAKCLTLAGHTGAVLGVGISADGQCIVSASEDGTVKVWDSLSGQERFTLKGNSRHVHSVAISSDGRRIVSGSHDKTVTVWDAATGREERSLVGHTSAVLSVAISADGRRIVSGSADGKAIVWDAQTGRTECTLAGRAGAVLSVAISADGRRIVSASGRTATVWDAQTGREEFTLNGHTDLVYGVAIRPDGRRIVSASFDKKVKIWDAQTSREEYTLTGHTDSVYSVAISQDGRNVVSGGKDAMVMVWEGATGREELVLRGHTDSVTSVAISGDGQCIVSGSRDGAIKVWAVSACKQTTSQGAKMKTGAGGDDSQ
jgi:WD40 repeat protein/sterol desaturase/sphingolipid hydroxylase (fatty acid hydroxylase superfamily)